MKKAPLIAALILSVSAPNFAAESEDTTQEKGEKSLLDELFNVDRYYLCPEFPDCQTQDDENEEEILFIKETQNKKYQTSQSSDSDKSPQSN